MGNICELSINVVSEKKPKSLIGFAKKNVAGTGSVVYPVMDKESHRRIERQLTEGRLEHPTIGPNPLGHLG